MIEARRASPEDAAALLPLVSQYWQFEGVRGFESTAVLARLQRLLSSPARLLVAFGVPSA